MITLGQEFTRDCVALENRIGQWSKDLKAKLRAVHKEVGMMWAAGAVKRVPVDTSTLKNRILHNVYIDNQYVYVTEVGTNIPEYPIDLEFGTKWIAKGAVLALGTSTQITDQQAIHIWPAKAGVDFHADYTSVSINTQDERLNLAGNLAGPNKKGGPQEQMPWLRPAFNAIKTIVIDSLNQTMVIPPNPNP